MSGDEAALAVIATMESQAIPYMLVGSFSSNYYGIPRSTKDADFVIQLGTRTIRELTDLLGSSFRLDPQASFETVTMTARHVLEVVGSPFTIELFTLGDDPHDSIDWDYVHLGTQRHGTRTILDDIRRSIPTM